MSDSMQRFRWRVYDVVRLIPRGKVTTYGYVALLVGAPRHARHVGWALHTLPDELVWTLATADPGLSWSQAGRALSGSIPTPTGPVPWQRVVNARGCVSRHPDDDGTQRQIALLRAEGLEVTDTGVILGGLQAHGWWPDPGLIDTLEALGAEDRAESRSSSPL